VSKIVKISWTSLKVMDRKVNYLRFLTVITFVGINES